MEIQRLRYLRKKQFIYLNLFMTVAFGILGTLISLGFSQRTYYGILALLLIVLFVVKKTLVNKGWFLFNSLKELREYEQEKLGRELEKLNKSNTIANIILIVIFSLQAILSKANTNTEVPRQFPMIYIAFVLLMLVIFNIVQYLHVKKIDSTSIEEGFAKKTLLNGLILGTLIAFGFLGIMLFVLK